jgi:hypothetical protein
MEGQTRSKMLLDQLTGGQLEWVPMDDAFDIVSEFICYMNA